MSFPSSKNSSVLDTLRDKHRPVIVFGPSTEDHQMTRQRGAWVGALPEAGIKDRDMIVIEAPAQGEGQIGGEALPAEAVQDLRQAFDVTETGFAVIVIGRDGGEKCRWTEPVSAQEIFGKIDGMPMRQQEVEEKGGGKQ